MSILLSSAPRRRLVVLGLDGLPLALAHQLGASLPALRRLAEGAVTVRAELPELSPVNWTSLLTARGPEGHGIFGFSRLDPRTYHLSIAGSAQVACTTIFDALGAAGLVSRVINLPGTYPVRPLRGMMVTGFVSHDLASAAHPPFLAARLAEAGYKLEADTSRGAADPEYLLAELRATLASRLTALDMLWPDLAWDLFVHVFTETDRLFHFLMDAVLDTGHRLHLDCMRLLAHWDDALGRFLARYDALPGPKRLMVVADHGFTRLRTEVCVNTWLKKQGFLVPDGAPSSEWDAGVIGAGSTAFALDPGRIYIHTRDFARGRVSEADRPAVAAAIRDGLRDLTFDGEPVMEHVYTSDELYPGSRCAQVPDLVCLARPGFDLKAKFDRDEVFGLFGRTGAHTAHGAIFADTAGLRPERMRDVGAAILDHFNIPAQGA
ncbi:alkaline phosphatase family protein [Pseudodesulfovibrio pelocollis]|uniref:alkaline phosphatase family protein n=1 Tax=Pseudodesulfovibrio pelocollis TaxID=3051432 RepID=UPI00255AC4BA|nr:alkaline phosphatase family protein [Pseudodesulfovibrio sp. SB368]